MTPDQEREFFERQVDRDISRRHFLAWASRSGLGLGAMGALSSSVLAACAKGKSPAGGTSPTGRPGATDTLKIGVVAPFSGIGAFVGDIVNNSLKAAVVQLNATGGIGGRKAEVVSLDTGVDVTAGPKVFNQLASDPQVIGILWCGSPGFVQTYPLIKRAGIPVISVFNDPYSNGELYPVGDATGRSVFQVIAPDKFGKEVLADYAKNDRGYSSAAQLWDNLLDSTGISKRTFESAFGQAGLQLKGSETFTVADADFGPQLNRLRSAKPDLIYVDGFSGSTAGIVKQLAALGASYVDTPTAKGADWHPHIFGSPGGTGDKSWVTLAGSAARVGTVTAWHVGGLIYLPTFAIGDWMRKYLKKDPTGGEESPADGLATLLYGVKKAGTTDRAAVVSGIEEMGKVKFASVDFSYDATRHHSKTKDDIIIVTMERGAGGATVTDPPYELGTEWHRDQPFGETDAGPTQLVRPTLDANRRAHPDVMDEVLGRKYGTQCTHHADGTLGKECKIH